MVVLGMFGFGYALVPLYDVFCEITGLGGRTGVVQAESLDRVVDENRLVTVQFDGTVNSALPWEFRPVAAQMQIHPGQVYEAQFIARNRSEHDTIGQARPVVSPAVASKYFNKTECFCFTEQSLAGGEERAMPVRFVVSRELPAEIGTLTLSYIFFRIDSEG